MSDHQTDRHLNRRPVLKHIPLKPGYPLFMVLFLIFFSVPVMTHARQQRVLKQDLFSASFPTDDQGWACGRWGTVLHTEDGGQSWTRQESGVDYTLSAIRFTDPQTGWAVGEEGAIIHTKDGGLNWVKQTCPGNYFLMGLCFVNDQKGWAVTEWTTILYTEDGGNNWQVQYKGEDYILKAVSFCDPLNGWVVGEYGYIYHTSDGGRTWGHQAGSFAFSEDAFELVGENTLFDVHAVDPMRAWVVGIDGYIGRTLDGGATWEKVESDIEMSQLFGVCSDAEGATILIGGKGVLIVSPDGGNSFKVPEIDPPISYGWIYGISRRGLKGFVAVGKEGWIYLGDDKGMNWQRPEVAKGNE